jgi:integrase
MAKSFTARALSTARKHGRYSVGGNLYLLVAKSGSRSWVLRYKYAGQRHDMGLGSYPAVSIVRARAAVLEVRRQLAGGIDPLVRSAAPPVATTFRDVAISFIADRNLAWRNKKTKMQWERSLFVEALPIADKKPANITTHDVLSILRPLWDRKPSVAYRTRYRIEAVLDAAKVLGLRSGENAAAWRGNLALMLPSSRKVRQVRHHAALAIDDMPKVMRRLAESNGLAAAAMRFVALTAVRSGEATGARWREVDLSRKLWVIPESRTKSHRAHHVPLSPQALALLPNEGDGDALLFPGYAEGRPLSQSAISKAFKRAVKAAGVVPATPHGCRSTFRDWAGEVDGAPDELAEVAIGHARGDATLIAYARGALLERRREMMARWAAYCSSASPA